MALEVPLSVKIEEWRKKAAEGTITTEEMRECIQTVRQSRMSAASTKSAPSKAKSTGPTKSMDDLLKELDDL